jgi:hypothetical protein
LDYTTRGLNARAKPWIQQDSPLTSPLDIISLGLPKSQSWPHDSPLDTPREVVHSAETTTSKGPDDLRLHAAVYANDLSYVRNLLESGFPANACDRDLTTAAHICCRDNLVQAALILYENKADFTTLRNSAGRTALEEAEYHNHTHLAAILISLVQGDDRKTNKGSNLSLKDVYNSASTSPTREFTRHARDLSPPKASPYFPFN